jgi:L-lactate dehydrogenase (cytochrome)
MPLNGQEVAEHNSRESCWVIVHVCSPELSEVTIGLTSTQGKAYDVTEFLPGASPFASPHRTWKLIIS